MTSYSEQHADHELSAANAAGMHANLNGVFGQAGASGFCLLTLNVDGIVPAHTPQMKQQHLLLHPVRSPSSETLGGP